MEAFVMTHPGWFVVLVFITSPMWALLGFLALMVIARVVDAVLP